MVLSKQEAHDPWHRIAPGQDHPIETAGLLSAMLFCKMGHYDKKYRGWLVVATRAGLDPDFNYKAVDFERFCITAHPRIVTVNGKIHQGKLKRSIECGVDIIFSGHLDVPHALHYINETLIDPGWALLAYHEKIFRRKGRVYVPEYPI